MNLIYIPLGLGVAALLISLALLVLHTLTRIPHPLRDRHVHDEEGYVGEPDLTIDLREIYTPEELDQVDHHFTETGPGWVDEAWRLGDRSPAMQALADLDLRLDRRGPTFRRRGHLE